MVLHGLGVTQFLCRVAHAEFSRKFIPACTTFLHVLHFNIRWVCVLLYVQVLSRDIRSLHQRRSQDSGHLMGLNLMGIQLQYSISDGTVQLISAAVSADVDAPVPM